METQGDEFLLGILADGQVDGLGNLSIPNTPQETDNISDDLDVQVVGTKVKRAKNFNSDEDEIVCSAWLNASKDPLHGANQNRSRFWGRVLAYFDEHNKRNIPRTESSIMHRWLIIQTQVNKFCSCYDMITRRNQSGATIEDKLAAATKIFEGLGNKDSKKFNVLPCWNVLKNEDKWKTKRIELLQLEKEAAAAKSNKKRKKQPTQVCEPRELEGRSNDHEEGNGADAETGAKKRGDGIKKVKASLRRGGGEACLEAIDKLWAKKEVADIKKEKAKNDRFMLSFDLDKQVLELDKERVDAEKTRAVADATRAAAEKTRAEAEMVKQGKDIMLVDMSSLNTLQREWIELMQQDIMAKRRGHII